VISHAREKPPTTCGGEQADLGRGKTGVAVHGEKAELERDTFVRASSLPLQKNVNLVNGPLIQFLRRGTALHARAAMGFSLLLLCVERRPVKVQYVLRFS
jgi:hypothetical protein